jgi:hypothetical protein
MIVLHLLYKVHSLPGNSLGSSPLIKVITIADVCELSSGKWRKRGFLWLNRRKPEESRRASRRDGKVVWGNYKWRLEQEFRSRGRRKRWALLPCQHHCLGSSEALARTRMVLGHKGPSKPRNNYIKVLSVFGDGITFWSCLVSLFLCIYVFQLFL